MKIAWFRPTPPEPSNPLDDTGQVISALQAGHIIDVFNRTRAHDFVWMHARDAYDVCVYEIDNTPSHQFIWPYVLHFPGVLALRTTTLHDSRAAALVRERRYDDYAEEMAFGGAPRPRAVSRRYLPRGSWPMLRAPLLASRVTVVSDPALVTTLARDHEGAHIRYAPVGVPAPPVSEAGGLQASGRKARRVTFGIADTTHATTIYRAARRAQMMGAEAKLLVDADVSLLLSDADVILALHWPSLGEPPTAALLGMAASKPVVVAETYATAAWPALDPQTWRPRGLSAGDTPIVVSIDPRDEEHSLMLAITRLVADEPLQDQLGRAGHAWWQSHARVDHAAAAWRNILEEAVTLTPPPRPHDWPHHLTADGTERAREILGQLDAHVDFLSETS